MIMEEKLLFLFNGFGSTIKEIALAIQDPNMTDDGYAAFIKYYLCGFETKGNKTEILWWKIDFVNEEDDFEIDLKPFATISEEIVDIVRLYRESELDEDNRQVFVTDLDGEYQKSDSNKIYDYLLKHAGFSQVLEPNDVEYLKTIIKEICSGYKSESQLRRENYDSGQHDANSHCWGEGETEFFEEEYSPSESEFESGSDDPLEGECE